MARAAETENRAQCFDEIAALFGSIDLDVLSDTAADTDTIINWPGCGVRTRKMRPADRSSTRPVHPIDPCLTPRMLEKPKYGTNVSTASDTNIV